MKTLLPLFLALSLPAFAAQKPAHAAAYNCSGSGASAEVLDAFDANLQRLYYTSAWPGARRRWR